MKPKIIAAAALLLGVFFSVAAAQEEVVKPASEAAEGLDLEAVSELFKESEDLEAFEKALNNPENGVNNLDLNEDGEVDYIRVMEEVEDDVHLVVLQAQLGEDDYQDVATIEIEKKGEEEVEMQIRGNEDLYGPDYYVVPRVTHVHTWPLIVRLYGPRYRPYRSRFYWGFYPPWWKPYRVVAVPVYHKRVVRYRPGTTFIVTRKGRVTGVKRVRYVPRRSPAVQKRAAVKRAPAKPAPAKKPAPAAAPPRRVRK